MKQYILTVVSALLFFSSCADEQLDRFAIDDISVAITQTWEGKFPHFEVKVSDNHGGGAGKLVLRVSYSDVLQKVTGIKDIELTGVDGQYSYTVKEFPLSFAGDTYKAFAYLEKEGCKIASKKLTMTVPGNYAPEVTSGTFVPYNDDTQDILYGLKGEVHLYGSNFSHYITAYPYNPLSMYIDSPSSCEVHQDKVVVSNCTVKFYGENSIILKLYGTSYQFNFDVPGLRIESVDKTVARINEPITMKVSGMKPEHTYEVYDATVVSAENDEIIFIPNQYWEDKKLQLIEKRNGGDLGFNTMYCNSSITITVQ